MSITPYTKQSLKAYCGPTCYTKAEAFLQRGEICNLIYYESNDWLDCFEVVSITKDQLREYRTRIELFLVDDDEQKNGFPYDIESNCSCYKNLCPHTIATLLILQERIQQGETSEDLLLESWLKSMRHDTRQKSQPHDASYELFFECAIEEPLLYHSHLAMPTITPRLLRRLKNGSLGAAKHWRPYDLNNPHLTLENKHLLVELAAASRLAGLKEHEIYQSSYSINEVQGEAVLEKLLQAGKLFLQDSPKDILSLGAPLDPGFKWKKNSNQMQTLKSSLSTKHIEVFFMQEAWYLNKKQKTIGRIQTNLSHFMLNHFLNMPEVPQKHAIKVNTTLAMFPGLDALPLIPAIADGQIPQGKPIPHIHLHMLAVTSPEKQDSPLKLPALRLFFQYEDIPVSWHDPMQIVNKNAQPLCLRNTQLEAQALQVLSKAGLTVLGNTPFLNHNKHHEHVHLFLEHSPLEFWERVIPRLKEQGWLIQIDDDYEYQLIEEEAQDWYANIEDGETSDWFSLELGVVIQGEKINLLPIIQNLLQTMSEKQQLSDLPNQVIYAKLPNNHYLPIPSERLHAIMQTLFELFDKKVLNDQNQLVLSKSEAARLIEIEKALGAAELRWLSPHRMQNLAKKIAGFKEIQQVPVPKGLHATLRPYQQEGLNWMQFLREYELAGILADDMGLGKTIQALSHLLVEKEQGRLTQPALVIAPTSLMYNWEQECKRFAPDLKVLVLYGAARKMHLDTLEHYDLILTTYPLILRDKEWLLKQTFHLLILDEAQFIKNSKSLSAQIVMQLKANHRLCLTGTPMENHLGELWSLFHFLMPGLLGDTKIFTQRYRTPIEKHGDNERRQILSRRIAPFLLRRTKALVAKELPPKIETISYVELDEDQRDLYETIRIAMEEKVRDEIAKLGLARSHIIILDALLKLRQVCCDPKLLKMETKKATISSCKINLLRDMLPELIEEGRRILIFSSFTQMLNIIEQTVQELKIDYVRLTGETQDRKTPIARFQNLEVPLFLISLKAGGTGLNLTAADTVIHIDPWWNPAAENQATDRAYRIGQNKTVFVYKIVTKGTVEEKILALQNKKQALADAIFSDKATEKSKLTEAELQVLFSAL